MKYYYYNDTIIYILSVYFVFSAPFRWMKQLPFEEVDSIQTTCANAMELWGYNIANNEDEYNILKPLKVFTLDSDKRVKETKQ